VDLVTDGVVWSDVERSIFRASVAGGVRASGGGLFTTGRLDDEPWLLSEETDAEIRMAAAAFWVEDRRRSTEGGRRKGELVRLEEPTEELSVEGDGLNRGAFGGGGGGGGGGGVS
jgi:hypothetical protein